jgi:hypothetical protein
VKNAPNTRIVVYHQYFRICQIPSSSANFKRAQAPDQVDAGYWARFWPLVGYAIGIAFVTWTVA